MVVESLSRNINKKHHSVMDIKSLLCSTDKDKESWGPVSPRPLPQSLVTPPGTPGKPSSEKEGLLLLSEVDPVCTTPPITPPKTRSSKTAIPKECHEYSATSVSQIEHERKPHVHDSKAKDPTSRNDIHISKDDEDDENHDETNRKKRKAFFVAKKDTIVPLLPQESPVRELFETQECGHKSIQSFRLFNVQPVRLRTKLKPYQLEGLSFLAYLYKNGVGGILGDEMGLGKTLQTLAFFQYLKENEEVQAQSPAPFLVVCPLSVMVSWVSEVSSWVPHLSITKYYGSRDQRRQQRSELEKRRTGPKPPVDIVLTTYDVLVTDLAWFRKAFNWRCIVLDEGHRIKNYLSKKAQALQKVKTNFKLVLTGTPIQNDLEELWSIFHFLYPEIFTEPTSRRFKEAFSLTEGKIDQNFLVKTKTFLQLVMLRRAKDSPGVNLGIPPKTDITLSVPLSELQRDWYLKILTGIDQLTPDTQQTRKPDQRITRKAVANLLMELRKCCIHPFMINEAIPDPYSIGQHIITNSGKFVVLQKLLQQIVIKQRKKIVIFSGFDQSLDLVEDLLTICQCDDDDAGFESLRLDGNTSSAWRNLIVHLFNADQRYMVLLVSIRAGGEGLNLTSSSAVVFLDQDWNPQAMNQAAARVHRIGQKNPVTIFKINSIGTVEEQMESKVAKKMYLAAKVTEDLQKAHAHCLEDTNSTTRQNGVTDTDETLLTKLVHRTAVCYSQEQVSTREIQKWDWNTVLAKCSQQGRVQSTKVTSKAEESAWLERVEKIKTDIFNGVRIDTKTRAFNVYHEEMKIDLIRADRRSGKSRTVNVDGYDVSKESLNCLPGEAVPIMVPTASNSDKVSGRPLVHEKTCFMCRSDNDNGHLQDCQICPRAFHRPCLKGTVNSWSEITNCLTCPQHRCWLCESAASHAGGLLYCCVLCEKAYCERCLEWESTTFVGGNFDYEELGYEPKNAYYIHCPVCKVNVTTEKRKFDDDAEDRCSSERRKKMRISMLLE